MGLRITLPAPRPDRPGQGRAGSGARPQAEPLAAVRPRRGTPSFHPYFLCGGAPLGARSMLSPSIVAKHARTRGLPPKINASTSRPRSDAKWGWEFDMLPAILGRTDLLAISPREGIL